MSAPEADPRLIRASDLIGLPVVAIDSGDDVAEIKDVVFDGASHRLLGFTLNKRGWFRGRLGAKLEASDVEALGPDAVMVRSTLALTNGQNVQPALAGETPTQPVLGIEVLSADGATIGTVSAVIVSAHQDPQAVGYEVSTSTGPAYVPISAELARSHDNLLVPAQATGVLHHDLAGLARALAGDPSPSSAEGPVDR